MKKLYSLIFSGLLLIANFYSTAQNLVKNPGFEEYVPDSIDNGYGNGCVCKAKYWFNVGPGTSDYYHSDYNFVYVGRVPHNENGTQATHAGKAYAGIYAFEITSPVNVREYIRAQLISPLIAG